MEIVLGVILFVAGMFWIFSSGPASDRVSKSDLDYMARFEARENQYAQDLDRAYREALKKERRTNFIP